MKKALIFFLLFMAFGAQAQVIPVGFIKQITAASPTISTSSVSNIGPYSATIGGNVTSIGGSSIIASGICYSSSNQSPTITDNVTTDGATTGTFTSSVLNLTQGTTYYVRAYATNSEGTAYGNQISFTSYGTVTSPYTAKVWMDRNLGATQVATSSTDEASYGDLYQWGRANDGGALRTAPKVTVQLTNVSERSINYIDPATYSQPWTSQSNWTTSTNGVYDVQPWNNTDGGANNPCPYGFRVPSTTEWNSEVSGMKGAGLFPTMANVQADALNSFLKIPMAGEMTNSGMVLSKATFWTANRDVTSINAQDIRFWPANPNIVFQRANYVRFRDSVRCIAK
jgi:uncharacterized protein (TIGR02145 family)